VRRLGRIAIKLLTTLSLLLLIVAISGWIRSNTRHDLVNWQPIDNSLAYVLLSADGQLTLGQGVMWGVESRARFYYSDERVAPLLLPSRFLWVIRYTSVKLRWIGIQDPADRRMILIAIPYWLICCVSLILPVARVFARGLSPLRAVKVGLCRNCGYDLRATPERCPECGTPSTSSGPGGYWSSG
jgi:hypothetical protein